MKDVGKLRSLSIIITDYEIGQSFKKTTRSQVPMEIW